MLYNSFQFLWLLPLILVAYYFLPILFVPLKISKTIVANRLLLIVSYALYMQWNPAYALILLGVTAETYLFALWIGNTVGQWRRKFLLISCGIGLALLPLLVFKYYSFITSSFASLFGWGELFYFSGCRVFVRCVFPAYPPRIQLVGLYAVCIFFSSDSVWPHQQGLFSASSNQRRKNIRSGRNSTRTEANIMGAVS